ncbi:sensor histidine kinase [Streptacidiphilus rugosus]|uniref:sensor histidine kinase n=1 Tax=Streptacidiphilus rugosus TaxID=405783 RepID=UPI000569AFC4|nr:sensor histidine kinase [Streptacidiphilus rugosus]
MNGDQGGKRIRGAIRELGGTVRADLVTPVFDRFSAEGRAARGAETPPRRKVPRRAVVLMTLLGLVLLAINTNQYAFSYRMGVPLGLLLGGVQSAALVGALWEPISAWWVSTLTMLLGAWYATAVHRGGGITFTMAGDAAVQAGWTPATIVLQALVLLMLALRVRSRIAVEALGITLFAALLAQLYKPDEQGSAIGFAVIVFSLAVLIGASLRGWRVARTQLVAQEELTAEERARRTLLEERTRIARELHDVVAHHMSVISIQAQVAPHLVENPPEELRENLAGIRQNAVEALAELRRVLGVLRGEDPYAEGVRDAPQPTLDRLPELMENVRGAGLGVTVETFGERRPLSPGAELSAFRIVQEALSNAMRHAPGAPVTVLLDYRSAGLTVRVANAAPDHPPTPAPGIGHGLLGMRERTAMLGGELATGPTPDGGYEVVAVLPVSLEDPA